MCMVRIRNLLKLVLWELLTLLSLWTSNRALTHCMHIHVHTYMYLHVRCQVQKLVPCGECFFIVATFLKVLYATNMKYDTHTH